MRGRRSSTCLWHTGTHSLLERPFPEKGPRRIQEPTRIRWTLVCLGAILTHVACEHEREYECDGWFRGAVSTPTAHHTINAAFNCPLAAQAPLCCRWVQLPFSAERSRWVQQVAVRCRDKLGVPHGSILPEDIRRWTLKTWVPQSPTAQGNYAECKLLPLVDLGTPATPKLFVILAKVSVRMTHCLLPLPSTHVNQLKPYNSIAEFHSNPTARGEAGLGLGEGDTSSLAKRRSRRF